jgi:hypothetical protein
MTPRRPGTILDMSTSTDPRADAEHHVVINGRRWRATDPAIPDALRSELVAELMDARRAVGAGLRAGVDGDVSRAPARLQQANLGLGERRAARREPASGTDDTAHDERLVATIRALLRHRAPESTICPSDAARVVGGIGWRTMMDAARSAAFRLQGQGVVDVRAAGARVEDSAHARGPLRIARGPEFD